MEDSIKNFHLQNITPVAFSCPGRPFSLSDHFFFIGSCFSEYLYHFLKADFFHCYINPFGNTYNPFSIAHSLSLLLDNKYINENEIFEYNGLFRHFAFHTKICKQDKLQFLTNVNRLIKDAVVDLLKTTIVVITFGTAFTYFSRKTGCVVNNCHTLPGSEFRRKLLEINEIIDSLQPMLFRLKKINKNMQVIFTLSPVRHLRDNAVENSLSKAVLRCAIDKLLSFPDTYYFPSYEIMLDELRDYRYYGNDLCHPNDQSIQYIMNRFYKSCFDTKTIKYLNKIETIKKACMHKPDHPETETYRKFIQTQEEKLAVLHNEYPGMLLPQSIKESFFDTGY